MEAQGHQLLGEILVDLGYVNLSHVNEARRRQMVRPNVLLGEYLVQLGHVTPAQLLEALSRQAEDLCRGAPLPSGENLTRGLPARAMELVQLVSLPMFQTIANQLEEGVFILAWGDRRPDDRFVFVNQTMASWAQMKPEAFVGKPLISVTNFLIRFFDNPQDFLSQIKAAVENRPQPSKMLWEASKPQPMKLEVWTIPLQNKDGEYIGEVGLAHPV
jgi:hypothetical protein